MGYAQETGYTPATIEGIMSALRVSINTAFNTNYTEENFVASNHYKYFYAAAQRLQQSEVKTSEIFLKLQQYIIQTNQRISNPVNTSPGIINKLEAEGYTASLKPITNTDAGKIFICVDVDDGTHATGSFTITSYANLLTTTPDTISIDGTTFTAQSGAATLGTATFQAATSNAATAASLALQINNHATTSTKVKAVANGAVVNLTAIHGGTTANAYTLGYTDNGGGNIGATKSGATLTGGVTNSGYAAVRLALCTLISQITVGGAVTQGTEAENIVLSNGQSFSYKYYLPNRLNPLLRLTITLSENNQVLIESPDDIKLKLLANILERYRLGKNFEPQRYYSVDEDAPWAQSVLLEYSIDGGSTYSNAVYDTNFDDFFNVDLANIELVEA